MEAIFVLFFILAVAVVAINVYCTVGRNVPWYLKSRERLIYDQTQLIRQVANQSYQGQSQKRGRGRGSRSGQSQVEGQIRIASAKEIQRQVESEEGYIPGYEAGKR